MSIFEAPSRKEKKAAGYPLLHVSEVLVFPRAVVPFTAMTRSTVAAIEAANREDRLVFVALHKSEKGSVPANAAGNPDAVADSAKITTGAAYARKVSPLRETGDMDAETGNGNRVAARDTSVREDRPGRREDSVHEWGTLCRVVQRVPMPDGSLRILLSGESRGHIERISFEKDHIRCTLSAPAEAWIPPSDWNAEDEAVARSVRKAFLAYAELARKIPETAVKSVETEEDPVALADQICQALLLPVTRKQALLESPGLRHCLSSLLTILESESHVMGLQKKITQKVRGKIEKNQREYYLHEQLKEINHELGKDKDENDAADLEARIAARKPPEEVIAKAKRELGRLAKLQPLSPEAGVSRTWLEWVADLPWSERAEENGDIRAAHGILDSDHFGMKKAKERILEFIAVRQLSPASKSPILCLVGPPGTGKTSLARSVARALGRPFVRISLGGLRDEAEIRGHRKTYVGALPGRIIQYMKKSSSVNPVFLLDEIDKMSSDFRGDPASALLEVLDPEQNRGFTDHYLEVPYDLSQVMFVTTANSLHSIPYPLLDRMEIIEIPGYSDFEKLGIAREFILPRALRDTGLESAKIDFDDSAILSIIRHYTMESGVRNLEREISHALRRLAIKALESGKPVTEFSASLGAKDLQALIGKRKREEADDTGVTGVGSAIGLAWTELGGAILPVECVSLDGKGELILTGNLGTVMKESAQTAFSWIRSRGGKNLPGLAHVASRAIHVHVPEGAIPKDGPSAGITLVACLHSLFSGHAPAPGFAMTGEITLSGKVLPIGGVKEKVLAANRNRLHSVILPEANRKDLDDIPEEVRKATTFHFVRNLEEALAILFPPGAKAAKGKTVAKKGDSGKTASKTARPNPAPAKRKLLEGKAKSPARGGAASGKRH